MWGPKWFQHKWKLMNLLKSKVRRNCFSNHISENKYSKKWWAEHLNGMKSYLLLKWFTNHMKCFQAMEAVWNKNYSRFHTFVSVVIHMLDAASSRLMSLMNFVKDAPKNPQWSIQPWLQIALSDCNSFWHENYLIFWLISSSTKGLRAHQHITSPRHCTHWNGNAKCKLYICFSTEPVVTDKR